MLCNKLHFFFFFLQRFCCCQQHFPVRHGRRSLFLYNVERPSQGHLGRWEVHLHGRTVSLHSLIHSGSFLHAGVNELLQWWRKLWGGHYLLVLNIITWFVILQCSEQRFVRQRSLTPRGMFPYPSFHSNIMQLPCLKSCVQKQWFSSEAEACVTKNAQKSSFFPSLPCFSCYKTLEDVLVDFKSWAQSSYDMFPAQLLGDDTNPIVETRSRSNQTRMSYVWEGNNDSLLCYFSMQAGLKSACRTGARTSTWPSRACSWCVLSGGRMRLEAFWQVKSRSTLLFKVFLVWNLNYSFVSDRSDKWGGAWNSIGCIWTC